MFRRKVQDEGFELRSGASSVAASIGTALHKGIAELLRIKQALGDFTWQETQKAVESALDCFRKDIANGTIWDKTTPHIETAEVQIQAMLEAFLPSLEEIDPVLIEHRFEYECSPLGDQAIPIKLTGTLDVADSLKRIWDHKTGASIPSAEPQAGGYIMLAEWHDFEVEGFILNYVKREGIRKSQAGLPPPMKLILDVEECKSAACRPVWFCKYSR